MSFNFNFGNMTKQMNNDNVGEVGGACIGCGNDFGPDSVADPGLPALKPNVAIIIIGLGFTLILVAAFALFAKFMRPHLSRQDQGTRMWEDVVKDGHLLDTTVIKNLPLVIYSSESFNGMNLDSECAVCLSAFEEKEELRLLPNCKHMFHPSCIDNWLRSHPSCPLCRSTIISSSWTLRNPPVPAEGGAVALSIFVSSQGAGTSPALSAASGDANAGASRRDDESSHRMEITVVQDQQQQPCQTETPCRAASWCGGTTVAPRNSKEMRKEVSEATGSSSAGHHRGADVHEFDPHHNAAGQSNQSSAQSVFIFIPQAPPVVPESSALGTGTVADGNKPLGIIPEGRSAISKLHEEVRSSLEASGSLRKFGNSTLQGVIGTSPMRDLSGQGGGAADVVPPSQDHSVQARHGVCTGDERIVYNQV